MTQTTSQRQHRSKPFDIKSFIPQVQEMSNESGETLDVYKDREIVRVTLHDWPMRGRYLTTVEPKFPKQGN